MPHRVVIAPDSFKGTIGAAAAAAAIAAGWHGVRHGDEVQLLPMADGGEGTVDAFATAVPGSTRMPVTVTGPEGTPVDATWLLIEASADVPLATGVVELANTSGIELLGTPPRLRPLDAHTRGFGEAIAAALAHGVDRLVLGIGSSASTDGGTGMLTALGARFTDAGGTPISDGGRGLAEVARADFSGLAPLPPGGVTVLSDVTNPLLGPARRGCGVRAAEGRRSPTRSPRSTPGSRGSLPSSTSIPRRREPAQPEAPGSRCSRGARRSSRARRRWRNSSDCARRWPRHPSSSRARDPSTDNPPPARCPPTSPPSPPKRGRRSRSSRAGSPRMPTSRRSRGASRSPSSRGSSEAAMADPARWLTEAGAALARSLG